MMSYIDRVRLADGSFDPVIHVSILTEDSTVLPDLSQSIIIDNLRDVDSIDSLSSPPRYNLGSDVPVDHDVHVDYSGTNGMAYNITYFTHTWVCNISAVRLSLGLILTLMAGSLPMTILILI